MIVAVGGIAGMTTVILVNIYAQTRIFMAMSRDGLMPKLFSKIHPKFATPYKSTLLVGTIMGLFAGLVPIKQLGDLASLGTLVMFIFVTISCIALRIKRPNIHRPFKCPALYLISTIAILACLYLIYNILAASGFGLVTKSFIGWALAGLAFYFLYSKQNADRIYKENH
jgi:APA family basic amino acid/polyamine antiporter